MKTKFFLAALAAGMVVGLTGCDRLTGGTGSDLEHNADYRRARNAEAAGDFHVAATYYRKTLRAVPEAGRAHLEFGVLCEEKLGDPLAALYHYRQFLELEPNAERRQVVDSYVERAKLAAMAKLPAAGAPNPAELMRLQAENTALAQENAALRARLTEPVTDAVVNSVPPPVAVTTNPSVPPPAAGPHTHTVQKGDTLFSIAIKYYGTRAAWEKIYAANRASLPNKDQLKIGQQLAIP